MRTLTILLCIVLSGAGFAQKSNTIVEIETEKGAFRVQLFPDQAPATVENFLQYISGGHYRGGSFFRTVIMDNQPDSPVKIEVIQAGVHPWRAYDLFPPIGLERTTRTGLKHLDGTISMARLAPDSAQASFFICIGDQPELDYGGKRNPDGQGFAAFGKVISGMDVVRKIHQSPCEGQGLMPPIMIVNAQLTTGN